MSATVPTGWCGRRRRVVARLSEAPRRAPAVRWDPRDAVPRLVAEMRRRLLPAPDDGDVVAVLTAAATSMRAGLSPSAALADAADASRGPAGAALRRAMDRHGTGAPLEVTVRGWSSERPSSAVRLAAAVLLMGLRTGGDLARALDAAAATLRQREALRGEVRALASQARASAVVVAVAPLAFLGLAAVTDPRVPAFLVGSPAGWACALGGLALDVAGLVWMRAITDRVGR